MATARAVYRATRLFFKEEEIEGSTGGATVALEPITDDTTVRLSTSPFFFSTTGAAKNRENLERQRCTYGLWMALGFLGAGTSQRTRGPYLDAQGEFTKEYAL